VILSILSGREHPYDENITRGVVRVSGHRDTTSFIGKSYDIASELNRWLTPPDDAIIPIHVERNGHPNISIFASRKG
jgi:hypothetical protein